MDGLIIAFTVGAVWVAVASGFAVFLSRAIGLAVKRRR